jgi:hypothetical protein
MLRATNLPISINMMFSDGLVKTIEAWQPLLCIHSLSCTIALFNIVATTLEFSSVAHSSDGYCYVPLNFYNIIIARSCMLM